MLSLYRRHTENCSHKSKGQDYIKCNCPVWCYGQGDDGKQIRESLKTRDWGRAGRREAKLESPDAPRFKPVAEAVTGFKQHIQSLEPSTQRKYKNVLRQFSEYCKGAGLEDLGEITVDRLDGYKASRELARTTAQKELETSRQFFGYCRDRDWLKDNPARRIKSARNIKPADVVPWKSRASWGPVTSSAVPIMSGAGRAPWCCCCITPHYGFRTWLHWRGTACGMVRFSCGLSRPAEWSTCPFRMTYRPLSKRCPTRGALGANRAISSGTASHPSGPW